MKWTQRTAEGVESGQDAEDRAAAARWFRRFLDNDVSTLPPEDFDEWAEWSEERLHLEQFWSLKRIWGCLRTAAKESGSRPAETDVAADEYDGSARISEWIARDTRKPKRWRPSRLTVFLATAACVTAILASVIRYGGYMWFLKPLGDPVRSYVTRPSEHRIIDLSDGSQITLGARTELTVHFTTNGRFIFLDRGEAWFAVTHNPLRPFTVLAGSGAVTAVGTEFEVRRELDSSDIERVVVAVTNGTVEVGPPNAASEEAAIEAVSKGAPESNAARGRTRGHKHKPEWTPARLVKGQELTYGADGPQGQVESVDLQEVLAWKEGRLEYRHTPLREVIPRVNRYSAKRIVLADGAVGELPFSGTVFEGQVGDWLRALQTAYPIEVTETADRFVIHYTSHREKSGE